MSEWPPSTYMDRLEAVRALIDRVDPGNDDETLHIVDIHPTWHNQGDAPFVAWSLGKHATVYVDFYDDQRVRVVLDADRPRWRVTTAEAARFIRVDHAMDGILLDALFEWGPNEFAHLVCQASRGGGPL